MSSPYSIFKKVEIKYKERKKASPYSCSINLWIWDKLDKSNFVHLELNKSSLDIKMGVGGSGESIAFVFWVFFSALTCVELGSNIICHDCPVDDQTVYQFLWESATLWSKYIWHHIREPMATIKLRLIFLYLAQTSIKKILGK